MCEHSNLDVSGYVEYFTYSHLQADLADFSEVAPSTHLECKIYKRKCPICGDPKAVKNRG